METCERLSVAPTHPRRQPAPPTTAAKAQAAMKSLATRAARGTLGRRQKETADFDEPLRALAVVELAAVA